MNGLSIWFPINKCIFLLEYIPVRFRATNKENSQANKIAAENE